MRNCVPASWRTIPFDLAFKNVTSSKLKLPRGSYSVTGIYPVIDQGEDYIGGYTDDETLVHPTPPPVVVFGDHTRAVKYVDRQFVQGADGVKVLAPSSAMSPRFAYWSLSHADITSRGYARHYSLVRKLEFLLPPLPEQHRIVEAVESYLTRLDDAVASLERVQRNLERYRASVLKAAVEGRLVPIEAALARKEGRSYEPASVLLERILVERKIRWIEDAAEKARAKAEARSLKAGKPWTPEDDALALAKARKTAETKYKEPEAPDTADLPTLPEGWCWTSIGEAFEVLVGATPSRRESTYWNGVIPWVSSGEIMFNRIRATRETITEAGLANTSTQVSPPGTVLIGMIGEGKTRGQVAIQEIAACNNQNSAAIRVSETPCISEYVYFYLESQYEQTRRRGSGGNQPALSKARVSVIPLPLPPAAEQRSIALALEEKLSVEQAITTQLVYAQKKSVRFRQSILKWAFEGKLVEQNPDDEPASALLERIRAERSEARR